MICNVACLRETLVAKQRNRPRIVYYTDRTMALVFKTWHINTEFGNYDGLTVMQLQTWLRLQNPIYPCDYCALMHINLNALLQHSANETTTKKCVLINEWMNAVIIVTHTWLSSFVSLVLCFFISLQLMYCRCQFLCDSTDWNTQTRALIGRNLSSIVCYGIILPLVEHR